MVLGDVQEKKDQMMDQLQTKQLFIYLPGESMRVFGLSAYLTIVLSSDHYWRSLLTPA